MYIFIVGATLQLYVFAQLLPVCSQAFTIKFAISARNTKVYKICKAIFSAFYNSSQPNSAILLILVCSFCGDLFASLCPVLKISLTMGIVY
jgi:hypothetical protein